MTAAGRPAAGRSSDGRPRPQGDGDRQRHARQLLRRRPVLDADAAVDHALRARRAKGPTCSTSAASRAGRAPSPSRSTRSCGGSSRSSRRWPRESRVPDLDRHDQGRGRPAGPRRRGVDHQRRHRAARRPRHGRGRRRAGAGVVLMHMQGTPADDAGRPPVRRRRRRGPTTSSPSGSTGAEAAGSPATRIAIDPGIGFGKTLRAQPGALAEPRSICQPGMCRPDRHLAQGVPGTITGRPMAERATSLGRLARWRPACRGRGSSGSTTSARWSTRSRSGRRSRVGETTR